SLIIAQDSGRGKMPAAIELAVASNLRNAISSGKVFMGHLQVDFFEMPPTTGAVAQLLRLTCWVVQWSNYVNHIEYMAFVNI
mgnify:CR=1